MKKLFRYARMAALPLALILPLAAQAPKEEGITRQQADDILNELRQIRQLLEKQGKGDTQSKDEEQPKMVKLSSKGAPMLGNVNAPLTIVEFTDYQCPFCQRFHSATYSELKKNFIDTGKARFFSRDLPLDFHPNAMQAAMAARCAADQGQFWKMREIMAANPDKLDLKNLLADAGDLKLDVNVFRKCVESSKYKNEIQTDVMDAMRIGADGTPAFVIGKSTPEGVDGELMVGAYPYAAFEEKLNAAK
jgi:protein-disulfide isomerase